MRLRTLLGRSTELAFLLCLMLGTLAAQRGTSPQEIESDPTGMYSFLHDGEFVQITVDAWHAPKPDEVFTVSGFISRYGEETSDKEQFLDQFFSKGSLRGSHLQFTTKQVHGTWYEFKGELKRGPAKSRADEGYYVVTGTLRENRVREGKTSSRQREITMKMFPDEEPGS
jgi:hypothetical protein